MALFETPLAGVGSGKAGRVKPTPSDKCNPVCLKTGCQWRQLPREFPAWSVVHYYFHCWTRNGTWERLHHLLRSRLRARCGRHKNPTAACLDSQSVKCTAAWAAWF
ncbi:transposase [Nitrosomonas sp. Nm58]|uniref:transposase n=1 Tax=Nitrosomonas sp. Nm58 TaxID=200126 RepID=UPI001C43670B